MIQVNIAKHAVSYPSKVLAREGGKHIYNIQLNESTLDCVDNGFFVGKGAFIELDLYAATLPTSVTGKVVAEAANGNYYVEIQSCAEGTLFIHQVPMIEEEYNRNFTKESNYTNAPDQVVRAYELAYGDVIELSAEAFAGKTIAVGNAVSLQAIADADAVMQLGK